MPPVESSSSARTGCGRGAEAKANLVQDRKGRPDLASGRARRDAMQDPKPLPDIEELPEPTLDAVAGGASDYVMPRPDDP